MIVIQDTLDPVRKASLDQQQKQDKLIPHKKLHVMYIKWQKPPKAINCKEKAFYFSLSVTEVAIMLGGTVV